MFFIERRRLAELAAKNRQGREGHGRGDPSVVLARADQVNRMKGSEREEAMGTSTSASCRRLTRRAGS
jgi:hypothetical protein